MTTKPNFVSLVCQAFDHLAIAGGRAVTEEYLEAMCRHLKLPTEQHVCLALALAHSSSPTVSAEALKALKTKVVDLMPGSCAPLPPVALQTLLALVSSHDVSVCVRACVRVVLPSPSVVLAELHICAKTAIAVLVLFESASPSRGKLIVPRAPHCRCLASCRELCTNRWHCLRHGRRRHCCPACRTSNR